MFIHGENSTNCQRLYILSHQKSVKTAIINTSEWCVKFFFFVFFEKFDLDLDQEPDPELSGKSDPDP